MIIVIFALISSMTLAYVLDEKNKLGLEKPVLTFNALASIVAFMLFIFATGDAGITAVETKDLMDFYSPGANHRIYCEYEKKNNFKRGGIYYCYYLETTEGPLTIETDKNFQNISFLSCEEHTKPTVTIKKDTLYLLKKVILFGIAKVNKNYYDLCLPSDGSCEK